MREILEDTAIGIEAIKSDSSDTARFLTLNDVLACDRTPEKTRDPSWDSGLSSIIWKPLSWLRFVLRFLQSCWYYVQSLFGNVQSPAFRALSRSGVLDGKSTTGMLQDPKMQSTTFTCTLYCISALASILGLKNVMTQVEIWSSITDLVTAAVEPLEAISSVLRGDQISSDLHMVISGWLYDYFATILRLQSVLKAHDVQRDIFENLCRQHRIPKDETFWNGTSGLKLQFRESQKCLRQTMAQLVSVRLLQSWHDLSPAVKATTRDLRDLSFRAAELRRLTLDCSDSHEERIRKMKALCTSISLHLEHDEVLVAHDLRELVRQWKKHEAISTIYPRVVTLEDRPKLNQTEAPLDTVSKSTPTVQSHDASDSTLGGDVEQNSDIKEQLGTRQLEAEMPVTPPHARHDFTPNILPPAEAFPTRRFAIELEQALSTRL